MNLTEFLPLDNYKSIQRLAAHLWKECDVIDDDMVMRILKFISTRKNKDLFMRCIKKAPGRKKYLSQQKQGRFKKSGSLVIAPNLYDWYKQIGERHKAAAAAIESHPRQHKAIKSKTDDRCYSQISPASPRPTKVNSALAERKLARKEEIMRRIEEDRIKRGVSVRCNKEDDLGDCCVSCEEQQKARTAKEHVVTKKARKVSIAEDVNSSGKLRIHNSKRQFLKIIPSGNLTHK